MTKIFTIFLLAVILPFTTVAYPAGELDPPETNYDYDPSIDQPEITIREEKDEFIEEYRMNGNLYMMKVTPKNMPSYYLIKHEQNGEWVREDTEGKAISLPMWVIGEF